MSDENETEKKDIHIYLDFNGKLPNEIFEKSVYLKIANLQKENPLVQLNESVYKGTYDNAIGTNLFFETTEANQMQYEGFEKRPPLTVNHIISATKVMHLKMVKVRPKKVISEQNKKFVYNLDWDYNTLLEKFENGTLKIEDIVSQESPDEDKQEGEDQEVEMKDDREETKKMPVSNKSQDKQPFKKLDTDSPGKILEVDYEKLKILAGRPVKRQPPPEFVEECDSKYKEAYEYHNIKKQILQPSDAFRIENVTEVNESTLSDCVDIDRCVLYGLLKPSSDFPRMLSPEEKRAVLTLENFDNLSLSARYYVLDSHVEDLEKYLATLTEGELEKTDEYGRTPGETLGIYRKLRNAVRKRIVDIKASLQS